MTGAHGVPARGLPVQGTPVPGEAAPGKAAPGEAAQGRHDPRRLRLAAYPVVHTLRSRFSDMDAQGHVNNVALASYYEDARATFNRELFGGGESVAQRGFHFVVARVTIDYLGEVRHPGEYRIGVGLGRIGSSSMTHTSGLFDGERCLGLCETVMVRVAGGAPAPFPPEQRELMETTRFPVERS